MEYTATLFWGAWQVDVVSKRCQEPGCAKQPSFGFPGGKKQFCLEHKVADMVCHPGVRNPSCTLADWAVPIAAFAIDRFLDVAHPTRAVKFPDAHSTLHVVAQATGGRRAPSRSWTAL